MAIESRELALRPTRRRVYYPVSDGEPLGETDCHGVATVYAKYSLGHRFKDRMDVYVAMDNFVYFEEGNPRSVVSPDCYVVFGVEKRVRKCYMTWLEGGKTPTVVFEMTSKSTRDVDMGRKFQIYEQILRVPEYFLFDPTGDYLSPRLKGYRLIDGQYKDIPMIDGRLYSEELDLEMEVVGDQFRFIDPVTQERLPDHDETAKSAAKNKLEAQVQTERADKEAERADREAEIAKNEAERADREAKIAKNEAERADREAELAKIEAERADREAERARTAEAEIARLRALLEGRAE